MARVEDTGSTRTAETNGTGSNNNDKVVDLHELSMQLERKREQIMRFPATATDGYQEQAIKKLHRQPVVAGKWTDKYSRQHVLLRFNSSQDTKPAFKGLYDELRAESIMVYDSLTPKERNHERTISVEVAQLYKEHPRMNARYSGYSVTVWEINNRSSSMIIDTSAFTTETLPKTLQDHRLQALMRAAMAAMAARRARPAPAQQPTRPAAPAAQAAPASAPAPAAPAPAAPAPAPAASASASTPAAQTAAPPSAQQPAEHTSTLLDTLLESDKSYGESDSEEEPLASRRAAARTTRQTRQQTRQSATQPTQRAQRPQPKKADKRTAPASPATATKPAHKQPRHTGLPLANQFSVFEDILNEGDQSGPSSAGAPDPTQARMDSSGDGQAA
jgi:hypothetical protein